MVALYNELREGILNELNRQGLLSTDDEDYQNKANDMTTKAVNLLKEQMAKDAVAKLQVNMGVRQALRE